MDVDTLSHLNRYNNRLKLKSPPLSGIRDNRVCFVFPCDGVTMEAPSKEGKSMIGALST